MQSKLGSLIEQLLNTATGFIISVLGWQYIVQPYWGLKTSFYENLSITLFFTVLSIARSYTWRRFFNWYTYTREERKKKWHD